MGHVIQLRNEVSVGSSREISHIFVLTRSASVFECKETYSFYESLFMMKTHEESYLQFAYCCSVAIFSFYNVAYMLHRYSTDLA